MQNNELEQSNLFTVPIYNYRYKTHNEHQSHLIDTLRDYKTKAANQNRKHIRTFITADDLQHHSNFLDLITQIGNIIPFIKKDWNLESNTKIGIRKMWGSITEPGGLLMPHNEPFTFLYGVYFTKTPNYSGFIEVDSPVRNNEYFSLLHPVDNNPLNSSKVSLMMPEGNIFIIPGYLSSQVLTNESEEDRYLIHFSLAIVE